MHRERSGFFASTWNYLNIIFKKNVFLNFLRSGLMMQKTASLYFCTPD
ncbi:Uncharacterized protein dnm_094770 [Desulfonema magnum]|uniref:Uncharacterized protein n=1 Tax=Desulfonema magnum TaxID=45655 RepID=A0A975BX76_9BACT|nr:Uncharacterized protein dnm_094770 [Desulfonema magnum]